MTWLLLACLYLLPFALCESISDLLSHPVRYAAWTRPATVAALQQLLSNLSSEQNVAAAFCWPGMLPSHLPHEV